MKTARVLILDDELFVVSSLAAALREAGYAIDFVTTSEAALRKLESAQPYDVLIQDVMRPAEGPTAGFQFYERALRDRFPALPLIFLSLSTYAFGGFETTLDDRDRQRCFFLDKLATTPKALSDFVQAVLARKVEHLYAGVAEPDVPESRVQLITWRDTLKHRLAERPDDVHLLSPRSFEQLVAEILNDMGL